MAQDKHRRPGSRAFRRAGGRLVGPERRLGDAAQAEPGAARLRPRHDRPCIGRPTSMASSRWPARPRSTSAAARGCWPSRWRGSGRKVTAVDAAPEADRGGQGPCGGAGAGDRLSRGRRGGGRGQVRPGHRDGGDRACRRPAGVRRQPRGAAGAGRADDPLHPQPDRLVEAADHHAGGGLRPDPQGHARLRPSSSTPTTMRGLLAHAGLECIDFEGIAISPDARAASERGPAA